MGGYFHRRGAAELLYDTLPFVDLRHSFSVLPYVCRLLRAYTTSIIISAPAVTRIYLLLTLSTTST